MVPLANKLTKALQSFYSEGENMKIWQISLGAGTQYGGESFPKQFRPCYESCGQDNLSQSLLLQSIFKTSAYSVLQSWYLYCQQRISWLCFWMTIRTSLRILSAVPPFRSTTVSCFVSRDVLHSYNVDLTIIDCTFGHIYGRGLKPSLGPVLPKSLPMALKRYSLWCHILS